MIKCLHRLDKRTCELQFTVSLARGSVKQNPGKVELPNRAVLDDNRGIQGDFNSMGMPAGVPIRENIPELI
ncbi:MAG: hypothetical protein V1792_28175 [Pseudomonadota bacterium]